MRKRQINVVEVEEIEVVVGRCGGWRPRVLLVLGIHAVGGRYSNDRRTAPHRLVRLRLPRVEAAATR